MHVESDQLLKISRFRVGRNGYAYAVFFKRIGSFQIETDLQKQLELKTCYRVMYSPNSNKLWKIKPETNQTVISQLLSKQTLNSTSTDDLSDSLKLSTSQRKVIAKLIFRNSIIGIIMYFFIGNGIKNLILWEFDDLFMLNSMLSSIFLLFLLYLIFQILCELIELISGHIQSTSDQLTSLALSGSPRSFRYTATFQQLGKTFVTQQHYMHMRKGERYRIVYSRWSKLVWDVQKIS